MGEAMPFGRIGVPEDIAGAAVLLASSDADYIVAHTLNVHGGNWMAEAPPRLSRRGRP